MERERILITVRTYPNISAKHTETVCTGGINDRGMWRRLYPVRLRYLEAENQYHTNDVVTVVLRPGKDGRPETRTPDNATIKVEAHLDDWEARCNWIEPTILDSMKAMLAKDRTIGPVRVKEVMEFIANPIEVGWTADEQMKLAQLDLFEERKPLEKIPFDFRVIWKDGEGFEHDSKLIAWEVGQTWRKWRNSGFDNVIDRMRDKWMNDVFHSSRNVAFYMGNMARFRDTFMICGWFNPPGKFADDPKLF